MRELAFAPFFVNAGHISKRQSAIYALSGWANSCERRLLNLHCGQFLPHERHTHWAAEMIDRCKFLVSPCGTWGLNLTPWFLK